MPTPASPMMEIGLAPAFLGPFKAVQKKLKLPFPSHKGGQSPLGTDIKPGSSGAGGNDLVDLDRFFLALDLFFTQGLKTEEALRSA